MAFMNWRIEPNDYILNMKNLADGFLLSAIELASGCLTEYKHKKADILISPIFHNLNHCIELYLKCLIWIANERLGRQDKFDGTHDINKLYKTLTDRISYLTEYIILDEFKNATRNWHCILMNCLKKIKSANGKIKMDFPRYPFELSLQDQFYALDQGTIEIDLENFVERFTVVKDQFAKLF